MLLIDGVKYELRTPSTEDELEQMVKEHAQDIFGEQSIYFDRKQKLKSLAGVGSIPDGLVIIFGDAPEWHIAEVELSSHDPYQHVVPQVDRFINAVDNPNSRNEIVEALYNAIENDEFTKVKIRQMIGQNKDIHKSLSDLIVRPPTITIVIEKDTSQLREALKKYTQKKVVEFQTLTREGVGLAVHAHLFKPLYEDIELTLPPPKPGNAFEVSLVPSSIKYYYIHIPVGEKHLFPDFKTTLQLETDIGSIETGFYVDPSWGYWLQKGLVKWFKAHPELKPGDKVIIRVAEPMKKYHLEIVK